MKEITEEIFTGILDDLEGVIFLINPEGTVLQLNDRMASIVRLPKLTAVNRHLSRIFPLEIARYLIEEGKKTLATGRKQDIPKKMLILPGLGIRYFHIRIIPYRRASKGAWIAYVMRDITSRESKEMASEKARENAEAEARARRIFLAKMSHEIRTPMNGIMGMTDLALQADPPEEIADYLEIIKKSSDSLLNIINDILDYSKVESGKMELEELPFNLKQLIEETISIFNPEIKKKNIEVNTLFCPDLPGNIIGDPTRIKQIFINLLGNAVKFTDNGTIIIGINKDETPSAFNHEENTISLLCYVEDTGIGIESEKLVNIFEPFLQSDSAISREYGGTGLGLSICKSLIQLMGGEIKVDSNPGKGSRFYFNLILKSAENLKKDNKISMESKIFNYKWSGYSVLLAEDNRVNRIIAEKLLTRAGLKVINCENGIEAVELWEIEKPDLILMDLQMPEMDGTEATEQIRKIEKEKGLNRIPIIALTAHIMSEEKNYAINSGMNGWVEKPVKPEMLYSEIARFLPEDKEEEK